MFVARNRALSVIYEFAVSFLSIGKKVFLPANICSSVPMMYQKAGIPIQMMDISPDSLTMDIKRVKSILESGYSDFQAVHYVYSYGAYIDEDVSGLREISDKFGIKIIADKCLCIPDIDFDTHVCQFDMEVYSTGHCKSLDIDYGGFAYVKDKLSHRWQENGLEFEKKALMEVNGDLENDNYQPDKWKKLNWLDGGGVDTALYQKQIKDRYDEVIKKKSALNEIYKSIIPKCFQVGDKYNDWRFNCRLSNAEEIVKKIFEAGFFASRHYRAWGDGFFSSNSFPVAKRCHNTIVNLFNDKYFDEYKAEQTAIIVKKHGKLYEE